MPAPSPMQCTSQDCTFSTPAGIPTFELIIKTLEVHLQAAHALNTTNVSNGASQVKAERPKRPSVKIGLNESDWDFFKHKWDSYSWQTKFEHAWGK